MTHESVKYICKTVLSLAVIAAAAYQYNVMWLVFLLLIWA